MPTLQSPRLSIPPVAPLRKWRHQSRLERTETDRKSDAPGDHVPDTTRHGGGDVIHSPRARTRGLGLPGSGGNG
jgi:hypothetical protein